MGGRCGGEGPQGGDTPAMDLTTVLSSYKSFNFHLYVSVCTEEMESTGG